jgi:hypothetical protein
MRLDSGDAQGALHSITRPILARNVRKGLGDTQPPIPTFAAGKKEAEIRRERRGVQAVANNLEVHLPASHERPDLTSRAMQSWPQAAAMHGRRSAAEPPI